MVTVVVVVGGMFFSSICAIVRVCFYFEVVDVLGCQKQMCEV